MLAFELTVSGADGVGMDAEAAGQFTRARKALSRCKVVAENGEDDLRDQLLADGNVAVALKPELHAELS